MSSFISLTTCLTALMASLALAFSPSAKAESWRPVTHIGDLSSRYIIGGQRVSDGDPVSHSTIALYDEKHEYIFCTGTVISESYVLTAAHCVDSDINLEKFTVVFDLRVPTTQSEYARLVRKGLVARVVSATPNPKYVKSGANRNDIAVIKFDGSSFRHWDGLPKGYGPAKLHQTPEDLTFGKSIIAAGYGYVDAAEKKDPRGMMKATVTLTEVDSSAIEFRTDESKGQATCNGDSGGPAYADRGGSLELVGVTARGDNDCKKFGVYTVVSTFVDWIHEIMAAGR